MKFKRFLASMLSVLTIVSCFAFTASADESANQEETIKQPILVRLAKKKDTQIAQCEHGSATTWNYDSKNNIAYSRLKPNDEKPSNTFYLNGYGLNGALKATSTSVETMYMVGYFRTNINSEKLPYFRLVSIKDKDGNSVDVAYNGSAESKANFDGEWQKQIIAIPVKDFAANSQTSSQIQWYPAGVNENTAYTAAKGYYIDVAGFAIFEDEASAKAYDIKAACGLSDSEKNITVTFDPHNGSAVTTKTYLSSTWTAGENHYIEFPEDTLSRNGFTFKGWSATKHGAVIADTTKVSVGDKNITYYGVWKSTETETPTVGDCVYVSDLGCDECCHGLSATYPKGTVSGAMSVINKNSGVNTIKVVEKITSKKPGNIGTAAKKIYVTGNQSADDVFYIEKDTSLYLNGDVEFKNVTVNRGGGDGGVIAKGHNLTTAADVKTDINVNIAQDYYTSSNSDNSVIELNAGSYNKVQEGVFSGGKYTGNSTYNIGGKTTVASIGAGKGYSNGTSTCTQEYRGTSTMNIAGEASVATVDFSTSGAGSGGKNIGKFYGVRYYNIKDSAKVEAFQTTSKHATDRNADALIITISDKATVGAIKAGAAADTTSKRYVIFNNGVTAINVEDTQAVVMDVTGANLSAKAAYIASPTDNVYASVSGFEYALTDNSFNTVKIGETEYALSSFTNNVIPADKFAMGKNTVVFSKKETTEKPEIEKQLEAKYADYEIVYVSSNGSGTKDGSSVANAYADIQAAVKAKAGANKKVVFAITEDYAMVSNINNNWAVQGDVVVTSAGGKLDITNAAINLGSDNNANVIFENITIVKSEDNERGISALGNNLTLAETVTVESVGQAMYVNASADGNSATNGNTITVNTSSVQVRASGFSGCNITGNVEYIIGKNANVTNILAVGKVGGTNQHKFKGNATVTVKDNAKVANISARESSVSKLEGNLNVNVTGNAEVTTINFNGENSVSGNAVAKIDGGTVGTIKADTNAAAKTAAIINNDKATVTTIGNGINYIVKYNGSKGDVTLSDDVSTIKVVPNDGIKYIKITNGETVNTYNVSGDEVELAQDLNAIPLATGTTNVEFLADGTEKVTLSFYTNNPEEVAVPWITKKVAPEATDDVLPIWSDVEREPKGRNDIFARPARDGYRFLGWATTKTATTPDVDFATFKAPNESKSYYAVWEQATMLKGDGTDVTVKLYSEFTAPTENFAYYNKDNDVFQKAYTSDGTEYTTINSTKKVYGLGGSDTKEGSYYGKADKGIWFKWNDGKYIGVKPQMTGKVNVAYVVSNITSDKRGFWLEAGNVNGSINIDSATSTENRVVILQTTLDSDDIIKYAATYDFNNDTIKVSQLEGIYVWAVPEEPVSTKVYLSDNGIDTNNGLTAETPVKTIEKVQEILTANENIDTLVIVGTVKYTSGKTIGVPSRKITITAHDENSLFDFDDTKVADERLICGGDVEFKNIKVSGFTGDGRISANGYTLTIGEGFSSTANQFSISTDAKKDSNIIVKSGNIAKILPGFHGYDTYPNTAKVTISGKNTTVDEIALAHGYKTPNNGYTGKLYADIKDGATVKNILVDSDNNNCTVNYDGIRYFTITDSTVNAIRTTGRHKGYEQETNTATAKTQSGITVFEINGTSQIGSMAPSAESLDDATRIIIFNNYGYSADIVKDTEAISVNVKNGSLKASITDNAFNGFTYTTEKSRVFINDNTYELSNFTDNVIPAGKFSAGLNTVIFTDTAVSKITWVNGEEQTVELAENGSKLSHANPTKKPDKNYYYTFDAWYTTVGEQEEKVDLATYEVSGNVTLTAKFISKAMPDGVSKKFGNVSSVDGKGGFTSSVVEKDGTQDAVKITPDASSAEQIRIEGWASFPLNYSTGSQNARVDSNIYKYFVVRYYYDAGNNTDERTIELKVMNGGEGSASEVMTAGKWSYIACELTNAPIQFHIYPMNGKRASTLAANNEVFYLNTITLFKDKPTIANIQFKNDETVLYAIEALNGESVKYNGETPVNGEKLFAGWKMVDDTTDTVYTNDDIADLSFTNDTVFTAVFTEKPETFPTTPTYRTYGTYDITNGTYTVEIKVGGAKFAGGSFGFNFPQEQMTFVSASANDQIGAEFLANDTSNTLSPIYANSNGNYANTWTISAPENGGMCDASEEWLTVATLNFTMNAEQRAVFVNARKTIAEFVIDNPDIKYYNNGHYLVYPYVETIETPKNEIIYEKHIDVETQSKQADVTFEITLPEKSGATNANIGSITYYLKADENDVSKHKSVVFDAKGTTVDETQKLTKTIESLTVGATYVFKIQKNGYIPVSVELTVTDDAENKVTETLICGDIKGTENAICGDGKINLDDFIRVIRGFESDEGKDEDEKKALEDYKANVDINEDGAINVEDLAIIKINFGNPQNDAE